MPYTNKEARRDYMRDYRKKKSVNPLEASDYGITGDNREDNVNRVDPAWEHVKEFIQRPSPRMPNLERLQRIAGSLGKNAHEVWFGNLTMQDIGQVIGTLPPVLAKPQ